MGGSGWIRGWIVLGALLGMGVQVGGASDQAYSGYQNDISGKLGDIRGNPMNECGALFRMKKAPETTRNFHEL